MNKLQIIFIIILCGNIFADISINTTGGIFYLNSSACYFDETSNNTFCIQPSNVTAILNSTTQTFTAVDGAQARFGGYPPIMQNLTCGSPFMSIEPLVLIQTMPLKYNRVDSINPSGSAFYPEINLTVQANSCTIVYNNSNCTVNTTIEGLHNYTGSITCGTPYENDDYNIFINTTAAHIGTDYLLPSQIKEYQACGLIAVCQAPLPTVCENCSNFDAMKLRFGCVGERQLNLGETTDACGILVKAPVAPPVEYVNISAGETTTNLQKGYDITCNQYDCGSEALSRLNLSEFNCTTNITKPDGTQICLELWQSDCSTDQILSGEVGINQCFGQKVTSFSNQYNTCTTEKEGEKQRADGCEQADEKAMFWGYMFLGFIGLLVFFYSIPIYFKHFVKRKKKVPEGVTNIDGK